MTALFLWTLQSADEGPATIPAATRPATARGMRTPRTPPRRQKSGYKLPFDVTRRFAQPLGIHLDEWKSRIIEIDKGVVRRLPVPERGEEQFGPMEPRR